MSIFKEIPPTAGWQIRARELLSPILYRGNLEEDFKSYLGIPYAQVTYSGTAALYLILESLKSLSPKKTVVIPSFVCPLVPLAVKRAGLKVTACDINKDNFGFDKGALQRLCTEDKDILAIIAVHLGGIPDDLESLKGIADENKIFLIEDCAQSLGALYKGKQCGTIGDFSFYSLCRGKGLTIYEGGVIACKDPKYGNAVDEKIRLLVKNNFLSESLKILELFGYWVFYRKELFWFAFRLPQAFWEWQGNKLKAATEYFTPDFDTYRVSKIRKSLGHAAFSRMPEEIASQREKAEDYIKGLKGTPGIKLITEPALTQSNYPYLTVLFDDPQKRKKTKDIFRNLSLGVSQIYEDAITDYDYLKSIVGNTVFPNARSLAERHLSLTTNSSLSKKELNSVVNIIKGL